MNWLVCNTLTEGNLAPSEIRRCRLCATQVWTSTTMATAVDSGQLQPICTNCYQRQPNTGPVVIPPRQADELAAAGLLPAFQAMVDELNERR